MNGLRRVSSSIKSGHALCDRRDGRLSGSTGDLSAGIRAVLRIHRSVSPDFEKAWLIRCTQNAVIDYLRKNKRRKELFLETPIGEVREVNGALQEKKYCDL